MTHEATAHAHANEGGAAMLPAISAIILAVLWGAYTVLVLYEIVSTPLPAI